MIPPDILALIPGCAEGEPPQLVQPLPGGRGCNLVLRVDTGAGRFVLRQRRPPLDRPGAAAQMELRGQVLAATAGIAPRVINAALDGRWLLMDFIDAPLWTEDHLLSAEGVARLGSRLEQLHALPAPAGVPAFDAELIANGYISQLQAGDAAAAAAHLPLVSRVRDLSQAISGLAGNNVLNHGDLQIGNLLGTAPVMIDWEYAQIVDATYDIACLLTYYPRLEARLDRLLASAGLSNLAEQAVLTLQRERFACLDRLWNAVNSTKAG
ncbi:MAG: aminoglycoside phosphotransferase family protein [Steroidobacteraceae bacterium]